MSNNKSYKIINNNSNPIGLVIILVFLHFHDRVHLKRRERDAGGRQATIEVGAGDHQLVVRVVLPQKRARGDALAHDLRTTSDRIDTS